MTDTRDLALTALAPAIWGSSYIVHRLVKCIERPVDIIQSKVIARYPLPDMPYSIFKKLFNAE